MMGLAELEGVFDYLSKMCAQHGVQKLVLFGSRARGDNADRSDIDIAVFMPDTSFATRAQLVQRIEDAPTLLKIDAVFVDGNTDPALRESIKKDGITVYEQVQRKARKL